MLIYNVIIMITLSLILNFIILFIILAILICVLVFTIFIILEAISPYQKYGIQHALKIKNHHMEYAKGIISKEEYFSKRNTKE